MTVKVARLLTAVALTLCLVAASACGGEDEQGGATTAAGTTANAGPKQVPPKTIGFVDLLAAGNFQRRVYMTFKDAAEHVGWEVKLTDAAGDAQKANAGVQSFVNQGVDAIVLNAIEPSTVRSALVAAEAAKIPVLAVGGESRHDLDDLLAGVYTESESELIAPLAELIAETEPKGAQIAIFRSDLFLSGKVRADTVQEIAKQQGLEVVADEDVGFDFAEAQKKAADILTANPDLKAFVPVFDVWTAPVVAAIKQAGKADSVNVYSVYANLQNVPLMRANENLVALADGNQAIGAAYAVDQLLAHWVDGKEISPTAPADLFAYEAVTRDAIPPKGQDGPVSIDEILAPFVERWDAAYTAAS